jgi:hypothetical protein
MHRVLVLVAFLATSFAVVQASNAQESQTPRLVEALAKTGFKKCSPEVGKVVRWIHEDDSKYAFVSTWNEKEPNQRSAFAATTERYADGEMVTTFSASPDISGKCSVSATQVFTSAKNCPVLREETFKTWKFLLDMGATSAYERENEKESTVFLTPMRNGGCMVVKQTAFYY